MRDRDSRAAVDQRRHRWQARRWTRAPRVTAVVLLSVLAGACGGGGETEPPDGTRQATIATPDGEQLEATVFEATTSGDAATGVVVAHGANANRSHWYEAAEQIASEAGATVVAVNLRGYGDSTGERRTNQDVDVIAAADWLREQGHEHVVLMGSSMGGTSVLVAASETEVDVVAALSPPTQSFAMDALGTAGAVEGDVFLAVAEDDQYAQGVRELGAAYGVEPMVVSGKGHGTGMFDDHSEVIDALVELVRSVR